jgi:hypothetical protein
MKWKVTFNAGKSKDIILRGIHIENPDLLSINATITIAVQNLILQTKHFLNNPPPPSYTLIVVYSNLV